MKINDLLKLQYFKILNLCAGEIHLKYLLQPWPGPLPQSYTFRNSAPGTQESLRVFGI